ncbi:MAG: transposase [Eubacteriaceae bacterium]|nr:transposase [Eubacteriaceae bacterium]
MQMKAPAYSEKLLAMLTGRIDEMGKSIEKYVAKPGCDYTRNRKLPFNIMMMLIISMGGNSIGHELLEGLGFDEGIPSCPAFSQQRKKILPQAFEDLFHSFNDSSCECKTFEGYRLLAADGSKLAIARNPEDESAFYPNGSRQAYSQMNLNALYDLMNNTYIDIDIQDGRLTHEGKALQKMAARSIIEKAILIADRGYESWNNFAYMDNKGWNYLIRAKDISSNGILSSLAATKNHRFDIDIEITLTRKKTKEIKSSPQKIRYLGSNQEFDFLTAKMNIIQ